MRAHAMLLDNRAGRLGVSGLAALAIVAAVVSSTLVLAPSRANAAGVYYVAPYGSDDGPGTIESPWATVEKGLTSLQPGDTLYLRDGTYVEEITYPEVSDGTSTSRITVKAYPGERPVIQGLFRIKGADYWTYEGVNVTWDLESGEPGQYMVKLKGGTGWIFTKAELWGAHSSGALRVAGDASDWAVSWLYVHDTYPTNEEDQDDLVLISTKDGGGVIERCLLINSENGRAIRIGPKKEEGNQTSNVTVRYNTMVNNQGPSNVQVFYTAHDNVIHHNIMVRTEGPDDPHVKRFVLSGDDNVVRDNVGWAAEDVVGSEPLVDGGGNLLIDPMFADPARGDYRPTNPDAMDYGVYAPEAPPGGEEGGPYRGFTDTGYWNTPLPVDAPVDANSAGILDWIKEDSTTNYIRLSGTDETGDWGQPIYWAEEDDPVYQITPTRYTLPDEFMDPGIRIPLGAEADETSDGAMTVYDLTAGYVSWLWDTEYDAVDDTWSAGGGSLHYLASNGLDGEWTEFPDTDPRNQGHRGIPAASFPVRLDEIDAGVIDHVLKIGVNTTKCENVFPMVGDECGTDAADAPPEGTRIRIKPSIDLTTYELSPAALVIAQALQTYGAVIGDQSGGPVSLKVEHTIAEGRGFLWEGVLESGSLSAIPLEDFEVIELGYSPPSAR